MKKGLIVIIFCSCLLMGCSKLENEEIAFSSLDYYEENNIPEVIIDTTEPRDSFDTNVTSDNSLEEVQTTTKAISRGENMYIEIETKAPDKRKFTYVYQGFDDCVTKGQELLPLFKDIYPNIKNSDCMYIKDDNNRRYWGVYFKTCTDPSIVCNFYY